MLEMASGIPQEKLPVEAEPQTRNTTLNNQSTTPTTEDVEKQRTNDPEESPAKQSAFKGLGWLDRFLAVWIFLAMAIGIILGNFVENTGPALQKGKFVGVSIPIGMYSRIV
jgi:ACR3 family arsenite transporter